MAAPTGVASQLRAIKNYDWPRGAISLRPVLFYSFDSSEDAASLFFVTDAPLTSSLDHAMSSEKSVIVVKPVPKNICPICNRASYSAGGIHPQCAMQQADEIRVSMIRAARASEPKVKKTPNQSWKKQCPKCDAKVHVRRDNCDCGHSFIGR